MAQGGKPSKPPRATARVREHVDSLREAGLDTEKFFNALIAIRDDNALPRDHREALYNLIAMESFVWYLEAIRDERIDREKLREAVNEIASTYDAAIRKTASGQKAAELLNKDIGRDPPSSTPATAPRDPGPRSGPAGSRTRGAKQAEPRARPRKK